MKEITRKELLRRALKWSLKLQKLKKLYMYAVLLDAGSKAQKRKVYSLRLNEEDLKETIAKAKRMARLNIEPLLYEDLKVPSDNDKKKIFGEIIDDDPFEYIDSKSSYNTIDYISSAEMKQGYVEFTQLFEEGLSVRQVEMILNLTTGEFTEKEKVANIKPVDTSALGTLVITIENY